MVRASSELAGAIKAASVQVAARASGLPTRSIQSYLEGTVPSVDRAQAVAEALGLEFYIGPVRNRRPEKSPAETQLAVAAMPQDDERVRRIQESLVAMSLALDELMPSETWGSADGDGLHVIGDGWFRIWMARHGANWEHCGMTDVETDEMEPTLSVGSAVVVDRSRRKPAETGVFMLRSGTHRVFRRLRRDESRRWIAYGDDPLCEEHRPTRRPNVVGRVLWSANDLRDSQRPFAKSPRSVYLLFAQQVGRPGLIQAARDVPFDRLHAFAVEQTGPVEREYEKKRSAWKAADDRGG